MDRFLEKYGLQEQITITSISEVETIVQKMESESNGEYYSFIFAFIDFLQPKHQRLVGRISENGFTVRRKIGFFDFFPNWAKATGEFQKTEKGTLISIKLNGIDKVSLIIVMGILTILFLIAGLVIIEALIPPIGEVNPLPSLFIIILFGFFFIWIPAMQAKWNIRRIKRDLNKYFI